jgi:copper homeostasis protein
LIKNMHDYTFELCVGNAGSAMNAIAASAHRIELCSGLDLGGLTPSLGLVGHLAALQRIDVCVLIRPREGDFVYSPAEIAVMCADISLCKKYGAQAVVIGALTEQGNIDQDAMERMIAAADGLDVVCHRAFDFLRDPWDGLEWMITRGVKRILTSGQASNAYAGRVLIRKLVEQANGRIEIMPGAGITAQNIAAIASETGAKTFHFTAKSRMSAGIRDLPGLDNAYWTNRIEDIREVMERL